jgi:anti-anti-sigma factor
MVVKLSEAPLDSTKAYAMSASLERMTGAAVDASALIASQPVTITSANYLDPQLDLEALDPDYLSVSVARRAACWMVELKGELDIAGISLLERHLQAIETEPPQVTVLDLRRLEFMDCSGVRTLLAAQRRTAGMGGRLLLVPGPDQVQRLLALTNTSSVFQFVDAGTL